MPTAYPTITDLEQFAASNGLEVGPFGPEALAAAIEEWERLTGFRPFVAEATPATYTYDPPLGAIPWLLDLEGGFVTVMQVAIDNGNDVLAPADYEVRRLYGPDGGPITHVRFKRSPGVEAQSVHITGRRGFADDIPHAAWLAVLELAAARLLESAQEGPAPVASVTQGSVSITYATGTSEKSSRWRTRARATAVSYRRF